MPATTGASHGIAAFGTLLVGTVFSKFVWDVLPPLGRLSQQAMIVLNTQAGIDVPTNEQFAGTVLIMVALSFVWGVAYQFGRH